MSLPSLFFNSTWLLVFADAAINHRLQRFAYAGLLTVF
jgi:hypothetical protein